MKIESLFPARCTDCFETYQPELEDTPIFTCWSCYRHSHNCAVISELGEAIEKIRGSNGFKWMCLDCSEKTNLSLKRKLTLYEIGADPQENPENPEDEKNGPAGEYSQDDTIHKSQFDPSQKTEKENELPFEKILKPCSFNRKGTCRHGPDGSKEVNGQTCRYEHKAAKIAPSYRRTSPEDVDQSSQDNCQVFVQYGRCKHGIKGNIKRDGKVCPGKHPRICKKLRKGAYGINGCKKGSQCEFLHPKLCRGSESKEKVCPNPATCKFFHTEGTRFGTRPVAPRAPTQRNEDKSPDPRPCADTETSVFLKSLVKEMKDGFLYQGQQIQHLMKALVQRDASSPVKPLTMDHSGIMPDYMMLPTERMGELQTTHPLIHRSQRSYY